MDLRPLVEEVEVGVAGVLEGQVFLVGLWLSSLVAALLSAGEAALVGCH